MAKTPMEPEKLADQVRSQVQDTGKNGQERKLPPVDQWNPEFSGDMDMRVARDGQWYYQGNPMKREALVRLFSTILRRDGDEYFLVTPVEKFRIQVDDVPFVAHSLEVEGHGESQQLRLASNAGDRFPVDEQHPLRVETDPDSDEPAPYVLVRSNLEARVERQTFYELAELATAGDGEFEGELGVWSGGRFHSLGSAG